MPELDYAFLADVARTKNGSVDALSIGIDQIHVTGLPFGIQVALVIRIRLTREDCARTHRIEAIVQDPDGGRLADIHINAQAEWPTPDPLGNRVNVGVILPMLLNLTVAGPHSIDLTIDGVAVKTIDVAVALSE